VQSSATETVSPSSGIQVYCDAATSRGNPAKQAGWGCVISVNGTVSFAAYGPLFQMGNNVAETLAVSNTLDVVTRLGLHGLTVYTDSVFAVNAINGESSPRDERVLSAVKRSAPVLKNLSIICAHCKRDQHPLQSFADYLARVGMLAPPRQYNGASIDVLLVEYTKWASRK
jgi:ribonuclease HI